MKFQTINDKKLFLIEIGDIETVSLVNDKWQPTTEMLETYTKNRQTLVPKLTDFRRSQSTKASWRRHKYNIMKGINRWHKSTSGKRMHRAIGNFLATRESFDFSKYSEELYELMKAVSSLKTHAIIELEYYIPVDEFVEYMELTEVIIQNSRTVFDKLLKNDTNIDESELEFLYRIVPESELLKHYDKDFLTLVESRKPTMEIDPLDDLYLTTLFKRSV